ncbi:hypothetical protein QJN61_25030, partial [Escherichia coli]
YAWSASFGPFIWTGEKVIYHYHIWKLNLFAEEYSNKYFIHDFILSVMDKRKSCIKYLFEYSSANKFNFHIW